LIGILLAGCSSTGGRYSAEYYTVQPGDTVYSIAWSAGVDYHDLAAWNGISSSYTIHPGQKLRIVPPGSGDSRRSATVDGGSVPGGVYRVRKGDTLYSIARRNRVTVSQLRQWNGLRHNSRIYPGQKLRLGESGPTGGSAATSKPRPGRHTAVARAAGNSEAPKRSAIKWSWPVRGELLSGYDQKAGRKGINIGGKKGEPIRAAAGGTIVYQGSGLRGYGRLIIVKHNNDFLSAYAHCDSFELKEGSTVRRGAVIAKMGSTGIRQNQLHFEIRYRGNPVNPIGYLPR